MLEGRTDIDGEKGPNRKGRSDRRADYLVLRVLKEVGKCKQTELEEEVMHTVDALQTMGTKSPIHFQRSSSANGVYSPGFLQALDRGVRTGRISEHGNGGYKLKTRGQEFLNNTDRLERLGVDENFIAKLEKVVSELY